MSKKKGKQHWTEQHPELLAQWHPTKNGDVTPTTCRMRDTVWWYLPYNDPETGKHFDFEWPAEVNSRTRGTGCPFLSGRKVWPGYNDLATKRPDLAKQWHPTKNGEKTPESVTCGSSDEVWWYLPYDDPETDKYFEFEWPARVADRTNGNGCPFLAGRDAWPGYNDLATKRPDLARQWHPTKNGEKTPESVTCGSGDEVWWYLPYDDPETGKHFDFNWSARVAARTNGVGCPFLSGQKVWPGYNDLATKRPDLAAQWHPIKNGEKIPELVTCHSNDEVWWYLPYDDPETGKYFEFEWPAIIADRTRGAGCPFLAGQKVWPGYNDLATKRPDLARQWHPTKNGEKTPDSITCSSGDKVWWYLPYDDPETGKYFEFEWPAIIADRTRGAGCPFLAGRKVWPGYNDLATKRPDLARQWHPTKNGEKIPELVTCHSNDDVWWLLPYEDPETGKHFDFEWPAKVANRTRGAGCPFLAGQKVWPGYNDLATKRPDLARQWHPTKNGEKTPDSVTCSSGDKVWWYLPYDDPETGGHFDFEWPARVAGRTNGLGCPFLSGRKVWKGFNDLETYFSEISKDWHPIRNRKKTPDCIYKYEHSPKRWWRCNQCGHEWRDYVSSRTIENRGCPKCRKEKAKYC